MLFMSSAVRITEFMLFVSENEIENNNFLRSQGEPEYVDEILNLSDENDKYTDDKKSTIS